ncbi:MAG: hypothetical protein C0436_00200 [Alphaproteobacteria bacterium]|nr:hypothetical protein [Alphaproteobacteria bacterium]
MGRPKKVGLDYFSLDTNWDTAMRLLKAKHGLLGIGCMVELYKTIYYEGYFITWDADSKLLFSVEHHIEISLLDQIVQEAVDRDMFDADMLKTYHILTSRGIQKRWRHIMDSLKRSDSEIDSRFDLISIKQIEGADGGENGDSDEFSPEETGVNSEETGVNSGFSAQKKGKEKKRKETILDNGTRKREPSAEEAFTLSRLLYDLHLSIDPGYKLTDGQLDKWAADIDKLHRIDGRDWDTIEAVIRWAKADPFWKANIIAGKKLREQFPKLIARMGGGPRDLSKVELD